MRWLPLVLARGPLLAQVMRDAHQIRGAIAYAPAAGRGC